MPSDLVSQACLVSLVPLDLASVGKVPSLPSSLRKISCTETGFKGPCQHRLKSVDSTGWSEIVQLIQDEVEAKYDRRIFLTGNSSYVGIVPLGRWTQIDLLEWL